ncbi:putative 5'-3' exonuclease [Buchnera aphidicola str. Bp (Baizongia pistaciae)]|uniref:5'-3' exonuclease n=1 Tax=Buchnera aphidicola subsp. Baizongia pistaciae (strain Bp) TaxID=224915 RepID=EX53_BUCBP|nr:5'-3' exonuclease [Buchnera aphidicola]Q89AD1.1 RecName: Full=5'-3' exonuclease [Buchnera aphidicola str. Bp (Baizongia pistaciae)]AAO27094.1 putative 5'-3' exonuclease [Buchnera aphidicola str. Bp (Baizongia pistaciae)]
MIIYKKNVNYLLIDGTSYLYRAYYAFLKFKNNFNKPCGAIYGMLNMLRSMLLKYPYSNIVVIFDSPQKTFRNELFIPYKKNRPKMPNDLKEQILPIHHIIKHIGIPIISIPHVEADDIIGTLATKLYKKKYFILISTNDKDLAQLVNIHIHVLIGTSNIVLDESKVKKKYGIIPKLIPDLLGLMGDNSDNIPGVPTVGKKTALILLKTFGSLENIYNNIEKIPKCLIKKAKTIYNNLHTYKKLAFLSQKLATIKTDINVNITTKKIKMLPPCTTEISNFFLHYKFYNWNKLLKQGLWLKNCK